MFIGKTDCFTVKKKDRPDKYYTSVTNCFLEYGNKKLQRGQLISHLCRLVLCIRKAIILPFDVFVDKLNQTICHDFLFSDNGVSRRVFEREKVGVYFRVIQSF